MTDTTDAAPETPAQAPEEAKPKPPQKAETDWRAEAKKWEQRSKENATAAQRLAELEEAQKTEAQKLAERAEAAERDLAAVRLESLRTRVAITKGVPAELVDRLRGDTEDDLTEDADRLLALLQPGKPRGDVAQGPRGESAVLNGDPLLNDLKAKLGIA